VGGDILTGVMDLSGIPLRANVELKARLRDPLQGVERVVAVCRRIGAVDQGEEEQVDTYFSMGRYRLKLRETARGGRAYLIGYSRADGEQARKSQVRVKAVPDPLPLKAALSRQWGVKAEVRKRRRAFLWAGRVRIHLDRVEGLGAFLELEAVLDPDRPEYDEDAARLDLARLGHDLGVEGRDLVPVSYSNLVPQRDPALR